MTAEPPWDVSRWASLITASGPDQSWQSPYDPELATRLPTSTAADVAAAAERGRAAQIGWSRRPVAARAAVLNEFADLVIEHRDRLLDLVQLECGKARSTAFEEVVHVALSARYYARIAGPTLRPHRRRGLVPGLTRVELQHPPKGLVGVIAPWNYPMSMAMSDGFGALAAGNAVIVKPDLQTPFCTLAAVDLLRQAGLPADLWTVVHGPGDQVGPELIKVSDYVCFTGSTRTGAGVAASCGEQLIGSSMELGGKNPLLVLDDVDVPSAAAGAVHATFANAGQLCVSAERIFVAEPVAEAFLAAFVDRVRALRLGNSLDYEHDVGGLINTDQLDRVSAQVRDAVTQGATVLCGGRARPDLGPLFYEPTVLTDVTREMSIFAEETFGPVVSVYRVRDDAEAIERANDSAYGLNASVWTSNSRRGRAVAAQLQCGTVNVNDGYSATFGSLDAPMGGMKRSGLGRRQGTEGLLRFTEPQSIASQSRLMPLGPTRLLPPRRYAAAMTGALELLRRFGRP